MRRLALPVLGGLPAMPLLSAGGPGLGEGGVIGGIFGTALGAVLHPAGGAAPAGDDAGAATDCGGGDVA
ncbi:MAG TPA: hypothetical protein VN329_06785 [Roseomonas sp.]|nr:hypothetical protein [Roseomonas sp.]